MLKDTKAKVMLILVMCIATLLVAILYDVLFLQATLIQLAIVEGGLIATVVLLVYGLLSRSALNSSIFIPYILLVIIFSIFLYVKFNSHTITIVVPKGYTGGISLVMSNIEKDILHVDSNGVGYITKRTFDKLHRKPIVLEDGKTDISNQAVGYNSSTFWGIGTASRISTSPNDTSTTIFFKTFEVVPIEKIGQKQYYYTDILECIDTANIYFK